MYRHVEHTAIGNYIMNYVSIAVLLLVSMIGSGNSAHAGPRDAGKIVVGPYPTKIFEDGKLYVTTTDDEYYPLAFILEKRGAGGAKETIEIDRYDVAGVDPKIESIFFYPVRRRENILVLVSWDINARTLGTYGTMYQVFGYEEDGIGGVRTNNLIGSDPRMGGMDGFEEGHESHYNYKTAAAVKKYIQENYK